MRGSLSDQDLTDYALNELQPEERLYVESMLAVSEECRHDVYQMIELTQMLEAGFEADAAKAPDYSLTGDQREKLVQFRRSTPLLHRAASIVALAACTAFVITHPAFLQMSDPAGKVAQVSSQMSKIVASAVAPDSKAFSMPLANIAAFAEDTASSWLPAAASAASDALEPIVCTPPSLLENAQVPSLGDMTP